MPVAFICLIVRCVGFVQQDLGSGEPTGVSSVRGCPKFSLCLTEPTPARSEPDSLQAKAEPVSDCGSTTVITHLKREGKTATAIAVRERSESI